MGVPWGVEHGRTNKYISLDIYLDRWRTFCASGFCDRFVFPIDEILYEFQRSDGNRVSISTREAPEVIAQMKSLGCIDDGYDEAELAEFDLLSDGIDLFLPDLMGFRDIKKPEFQWSHERADSLENLCCLSHIQWPLASDLRAAAIFCRQHWMMLGVSY
jgi:hypothetical protein